MMSLLLRAGLAVAACLLVLHLLGLAPPGKGPEGPSSLIAARS